MRRNWYHSTASSLGSLAQKECCRVMMCRKWAKHTAANLAVGTSKSIDYCKLLTRPINITYERGPVTIFWVWNIVIHCCVDMCRD